MNRKKIILSAVASFMILICGYFLYQYMVFISTDNAQVDAHTVMLAPKVPGYVVEVKVIEGQRVKRGDIMVEIDERDYKNTVNQMRGEGASVEARRRDAEKNYRRINDLYQKGAVTQQQFDNASAQMAEIRAKFEAVTANLAQAELNLENTKIKAPADGFIAKRSVERGQFSSPGVPLIGFVSAEERWITANFKETELEAIRIGAKVDISIDAISKKYIGKVESISAATGSTFALIPPDNATGNFTKVVQTVPVKILFEEIAENDITQLRAGLSAVVKVHRK